MNTHKKSLAVICYGVALCLLALIGPVKAQTLNPYLNALKARDVERLMELVEDGADVNQSLESGKTALMLASSLGRAGFVVRLIQAGAEVNARNHNGGTALMYSSLQGDPKSLGYLLESGARVNLAGTNGWTAIILAAVKNHYRAVSLLLGYGADPNHQDIYGWSALMRAANLDRSEGIRALIGAADIELDMRDDNGATALHHAAEKNHAQVVKQLLAAGADPGVQDNKGRTAAQRAQLSGFSQLAQLIRDHRG